MDYLNEKLITENWEPNNHHLVSIQCTAFNHEKYIAQCLDGFLMQKTTFPFEVIVHDDASTDNTRRIIEEYAEKYPNIIKPIYENENQYSKRDGSLSRIIDSKLNGDYLAFCEGDDYWSDPYKLQKQFDFLESNHEYSAVGHFTKAIDVQGNCINSFINTKQGDCGCCDLERWRLFAHYSSIFCINYLKKLSEKEYENYIGVECPGDRKLPVLLMRYGKLHVLPFWGSVYRYQSGPTSFTSTKANNRICYLWKEGFYLSKYAVSIGIDLHFKERQKRLVAYALKEYIRGRDKNSYKEIRYLEPSNIVSDFFSSIPVYCLQVTKKIREHE